jgi:hypothetical protein
MYLPIKHGASAVRGHETRAQLGSHETAHNNKKDAHTLTHGVKS